MKNIIYNSMYGLFLINLCLAPFAEDLRLMIAMGVIAFTARHIVMNMEVDE